MPQHESTRLRFLRDEAEGYLLLGLPERALNVLEVVGEQPAFHRQQFALLRGMAFRDLKRYGEAIGPLEQVVGDDRSNTSALLALGWCYKRTGELERAIDAVTRARRADPDDAIIVYNLACYWSLARNKSLALKFLREAFDLDGELRDLVSDESDFDFLRQDPDFQALVSLTV
jgi:tetratricopeptide (TPR) repeat protein